MPLILDLPPPLIFPKPAIIRPASDLYLATFPLPMISPGAAVGRTVVASSFLAENDKGNQTTHTESGVSIGAAPTAGFDRRWIVVGIGNEQNGTVQDTNTVTIDGESASQVSGTQADETTGSQDVRSQLWLGEVDTSNTTGDIVVSYAGSNRGSYVAWWHLLMPLGFEGTPHDVIGTTTTGGTVVTGTLDITVDGGLVAFSCHDKGTVSANWSGGVVTEDFSNNGQSSSACSGAHDDTSSDTSGATVTATWSGSDDICLSCISVSP